MTSRGRYAHPYSDQDNPQITKITWWFPDEEMNVDELVTTGKGTKACKGERFKHRNRNYNHYGNR